jgi:hypothetical protein
MSASCKHVTLGPVSPLASERTVRAQGFSLDGSSPVISTGSVLGAVDESVAGTVVTGSISTNELSTDELIEVDVESFGDVLVFDPPETKATTKQAAATIPTPDISRVRFSEVFIDGKILGQNGANSLYSGWGGWGCHSRHF